MTAKTTRTGTVTGETTTTGTGTGTVDRSAPSTFATRHAEHEARLAAGEPDPERRQLTNRVGIDEPQPAIEVSRVRA